MTAQQFKIEMDRLEKQFGPYGGERLKVLFAKVQPFSAAWFKTSVDSKIAYSRFIPLPSDFDDDIAQERDRQRVIERENSTQAAKEGWGCLGNDDKAEICRGIKNILSGQMRQEHKHAFISSLKRMAEMSAEEKTEGA